MSSVSLRYPALLIGLAAAPSLLFAQAKGWPRFAASDSANPRPIQASPLVADLDGDGWEEIVVISLDDSLTIFAHDGVPLPNYPITLGFGDGTMASAALGDVDDDDSLEIVIFGDGSGPDNGEEARLKIVDYATGAIQTIDLPNNAAASAKATPTLIDCYKFDGTSPHPEEEIIVRDGQGEIYIFSWDGSSYSNITPSGGLDTLPTSADNSYRDRYNLHQMSPSVSAHDLGFDQTLLVSPSTNGKIYSWVVTSISSSNTADNFSFISYTPIDTVGEFSFFGSGTLSNLDGTADGELDFVAGGSDGKVYAWEVYGDTPGSLRQNWPIATMGSVLSTPTIIDLDQDGSLEIIVGSTDDTVYVWNEDGSDFFATGQPAVTGGDVIGSAVVHDIDNQSGLEFFASSLDGWLYGWSSTGDALEGWPKKLNTPIFASPVVSDTHDARRAAVIAAGFNGTVYCFDLSTRYNRSYPSWGQFRGGPARTGNPSK